MTKTDRKNSILFFDVSKTEYLPLIHSVSESGFVPIINNTPLRKEIDAANIFFKKWESYKTSYISSLVDREVVRIAEGFANSLKHQEVQRVFASTAGNFLSETGEPFAERLVRALSEEIYTIEILHSLCQSENLKLIVLGCDNSNMERAVVLFARKTGIPTLQLAHGINGKVPKGEIASGGRAAGMHTLYSDYAAVFGQRTFDDMVEMGNDARRLFVTGCPFWDYLYSSAAQISSEEARRRLNLPLDKKIVVVCASYADGASPFFPAISHKLFQQHQMILETVNRLDGNIQVILRPHPHELQRATTSISVAQQVDELYHDWIKRNGYNQIRVIRDRKIEVLKAADIVVTFGSSSIIPEAMILQQPVIMMPWFHDPDYFFDEKVGVLIVEEDVKLQETIEDLFCKPQFSADIIRRQQKALPEINHKNDGRATERVADLIIDLATKSETPPNRAKASSPIFQEPSARHRRVRKPGSSETPNDKNHRLKILQIVHDSPFSYSGTELYTINLSKELQKSSHEVTILYPAVLQDKEPHYFETIHHKGQNVVQFNIYDKDAPVRSDFYNPSFDEPFQNYLSSQDFDLVHFQHLYGLSANWVSIANSFGLPVFLKIDDMFFYCRQIHLTENGKTYCSGPESIDKCFNCLNSKNNKMTDEATKLHEYLTFRKEFLQKIFQQVDFVHSTSHFLKRTSIENGFNNSEFHVIPTGISPFKVLKEKAREDEAIRIAFLGDIDARKGIQDFLAAIEGYQQKSIGHKQKTNLEFVIYGHHSNNDLYHDMLTRIKNLKNVEYKGPFSPEDRSRIFSEIDLFVMSSIGENYPFILREALFANVPVVAPEIAGVPEIVENGGNGFLYPPGDVQALGSIFLKLAKNPDILKELDPASDEVKLIATEVKELEKEYSRVILSSCSQAAQRV